MSAQTPAKITLEEITQRKKKLLNDDCSRASFCITHIDLIIR